MKRKYVMDADKEPRTKKKKPGTKRNLELN